MSSAAEPSSSAEADTDRMAGLNLQDESEGASLTANALQQSMPLDSFPISNNAPGFKYKYPQAKPTPPGIDDTVWNKIYTAADSRNYNKHSKSATESKKYRERGDTYQLALKMLEEKIEKDQRSDGPASKKAKNTAAKKTDSLTTIKQEPPSSRDVTPSADKMAMGIAEKIKSEGRARKAPSITPSSDHGTPAPTPAKKANSPAPPPPPKADKPGPKKKGTPGPVPRKKPGPKPKPKPEDHENTPSSNRTSQTPGPRNRSMGPSSGESSDAGEYCLCRGPDDHRMMVCCEGGCDEWYHCSCVGIDETDAKELLDVYICPKCHTSEKFTTWKRMCRFFNVGNFLGEKPCRKAARVDTVPPSKYCSDVCKKKFWAFVRSQLRDDDEPSKGGALSQKEVGFILKQCKTAAEIHALGAKPRLPKKEGADPDHPVGLDYLTPEEEQEIETIKAKKALIQSKIEGYQNQQKLLMMINKRAKIAAQQPNVEFKDLCGYDNRLAFNEAQFARWAASSEGKAALETGVLGPRTGETKEIGTHIPYPGQVIPPAPVVSDALDNVCLKKGKKCKHFTWREVHNQDYVYNQKMLKDELEKLSKAEAEMIDDAETREATKDYYSDNITIQLF